MTIFSNSLHPVLDWASNRPFNGLVVENLFSNKSSNNFLKTHFFDSLKVVPSIVTANCFDGNNGGCSHFCANSVCSCPSCWSLNEDGLTCGIDSGKATVTCRSDGIDVVIDKCVASDVEQSAIHLADASCGAVEESASEWKVSTGLSECGTEIEFVNDKLDISNTLMVGGASVGGLRFTNAHEIGFTCRYNNVATAANSFGAEAATVVFDINDVEAPVELDLQFNLQSYASDAFATTADLSTQSVQIGSSVYMRASPAAALPESLEFSVHKCSAGETGTETEVTVLDSCPVFEELNFTFKTEQSDQNAVDFSFTSFQLQSSAEVAEIELKCDINICPVNSEGCLNTCQVDSQPQTPSDFHLMVIIHENLSDSYMINSDGSQRTDVQITSPDGTSRYAVYAAPAIVAGKLHLFGGTKDAQRILRLDDCAMVVLAARLTNKYEVNHSALATDNGQKALICFGNYSPYNYCDVFDGTTAAATFSSEYSHRGSGNLGYYNGNPTSVGGIDSDGHYKVETLDEYGWRSLADHPEDTRKHNLVGLPNGDLLLIGGQLGDDLYTQKSSIWKLSVQGFYGSDWSIIGNLQQGVSWGSLILEGNSIYSFGGRSEGESSSYSSYGSPFQINSLQRIDLTEDGTIEKVELISDDAASRYFPFLLPTDTANSCILITDQNSDQ